jgi:CRISPR/Cas system-associated exonuclease Cas4 (RecB family)
MREKELHLSEPFFFNPSLFNKTKCLRKMQYLFGLYAFKKDIRDKLLLKEEKDMFSNLESGGKLHRIFDNGNSMHERYSKYFKEISILKEEELTLKDFEKRIKGRIDLLIEIDKTEYIVELKSMNGIQASKLKKPKPEHVLQILFYMYMMKIPQGFVLYENKNNQDILSFYIDYEKEKSKLEYPFNIIDTILNTSKKGVLLDKKLDKCTSCIFYDFCKEDVNIDQLLENPKLWFGGWEDEN